MTLYVVPRTRIARVDVCEYMYNKNDAIVSSLKHLAIGPLAHRAFACRQPHAFNHTRGRVPLV